MGFKNEPTKLGGISDGDTHSIGKEGQLGGLDHRHTHTHTHETCFLSKGWQGRMQSHRQGRLQYLCCEYGQKEISGTPAVCQAFVLTGWKSGKDLLS